MSERNKLLKKYITYLEKTTTNGNLFCLQNPTTYIYKGLN